MTRKKELETNFILVLAMGLIWYFTRWNFLLYAAGILVVLSLISRLVAGTVAGIWLSLANIIGLINSKILLTIIYIFLLTPIAFIFRVLGKQDHAKGNENSNMVARN
ncbi:MAG: putative Tic20 family protein, partial [Limisphaerales bacterium]